MKYDTFNREMQLNRAHQIYMICTSESDKQATTLRIPHSKYDEELMELCQVDGLYARKCHKLQFSTQPDIEEENNCLTLPRNWQHFIENLKNPLHNRLVANEIQVDYRQNNQKWSLLKSSIRRIVAFLVKSQSPLGIPEFPPLPIFIDSNQNSVSDDRSYIIWLDNL